jgi:hypothetical protein
LHGWCALFRRFRLLRPSVGPTSVRAPTGIEAGCRGRGHHVDSIEKQHLEVDVDIQR